jgi:hypothetical protein
VVCSFQLDLPSVSRPAVRTLPAPSMIDFSSYVKFTPITTEVFYCLSKLVSQLLNMLSSIATSSGDVSESEFVNQALRALATAAARSNHVIIYMYASSPRLQARPSSWTRLCSPRRAATSGAPFPHASQKLPRACCPENPNTLCAPITCMLPADDSPTLPCASRNSPCGHQCCSEASFLALCWRHFTVSCK